MSEGTWSPIAVSEGIAFGGGRAVVDRHSTNPDAFRVTIFKRADSGIDYVESMHLTRGELALVIHVCNDTLELTK